MTKSADGNQGLTHAHPHTQNWDTSSVLSQVDMRFLTGNREASWAVSEDFTKITDFYPGEGPIYFFFS